MPNFARKFFRDFLGLKPGRPSSPAIATPSVPSTNTNLVINQDERSLSEDKFNGTYPRLTRLHDGAILAVFTWRGPEQLRVLKISKSTDNGQTFMDFAEIIRGQGEIDNPFVIEVAPNHILAAFRNHDFGGEFGFTHFRITVYESRDGGQTWAYLSQAAEKSPPLGIWEPFMRHGLDGGLQLIYSHEFAPDDQRTMQVISYDRGKTWSSPRCIEGAADRFRDGMTGIAETMDTAENRPALVLVFETTRYGPHFNLEAVISYDDGYTWSHRHEIYVPPPGHNAGAPQIASLGDGSLVVVFMTDDQAEEVKWIHNAAIKVVHGSPPHGGRINWTMPAVVSPASSFWPGIMALDSQRALVTYEYGGPRARSVTWKPN